MDLLARVKPSSRIKSNNRKTHFLFHDVLYTTHIICGDLKFRDLILNFEFAPMVCLDVCSSFSFAVVVVAAVEGRMSRSTQKKQNDFQVLVRVV